MKLTKSDEKILKRWRTKNRLTANTFDKYVYMIAHYVKATDMSISELYTEALSEEDNKIPRYRKEITNHLLDLYNYLDNTNLTDNYKNSVIYVVKSFYNFIDVELPNIPNRYPSAPLSDNTEKMITKNLIKWMINNATVRDKAILSFAAMTGQSPNEIRNLTINDLIKCYNSELKQKVFNANDIVLRKKDILELDAPILHLTRLKTNTKYWVYLPSETSNYIIDYLNERINGNNVKIRIKSNEDYLFVTKSGKQHSSGGIGKIFVYVGDKCGFNNPDNFEGDTRILLSRDANKHRVWKAYNFRKYFINTCRRYAGTANGGDSEFIFTGTELADFFVGHRPRGSIKYYLQFNETDAKAMQKQYLQCLPYLSVETDVKELSTADKKEFEEIKSNYNKVLSELEDLKNYVRSKELVENWRLKNG